MEPGIYPNISNAEYHADRESYSSTLIKKMSVPAKARYYMDNPSEYKDVYRIGSAVHKRILEPADFDAEFLTGIDCGRRSAAYKQEWAQWFYEHGADGDHITSHKAAEWNGMFERLTGKTFVTPEEIKMIDEMAASLSSNQSAMRLLENGIAESSIYWTDQETGLNLRCRPEYLGSDCSDLKTTDLAEPHAVSRQIHRFGYHVSQAMYQDGIHQVLDEYVPFRFIFLEKEPPYLCAVYTIDDQAAELGWNTYRAYVRRLADCLESGHWPGIPNDDQLPLPRYAFYDQEIPEQ